MFSFNNKPSPGKVVLTKAAELRRKLCPAYALNLLDNNGFVSPKGTSPTCYSGANIKNGSCLFTLRATPRPSLWIHTDQIKSKGLGKNNYYFPVSKSAPKIKTRHVLIHGTSVEFPNSATIQWPTECI